MKAPQPTLAEIRKSPKIAGKRVAGVSDFLSDEDQAELRRVNAQKKRQKRFDAVDAAVAEIIARFGWDVYQKWNEGEIDPEWLARLLNAERAREKALLLSVEAVTYAAVSATLSKKPKDGLSRARKIIEEDQKIASGQ